MMTPSEVYKAYIAAENIGDRDGMERCLHPQLEVSVNGIMQLADRAADAKATDRLLAMYPDYRRHIHRILVSDQTVVAEWEMFGAGDCAADIPDLAVHGCTIAEVSAGVIVRARLYADPDALNRLMPPHEPVPGHFTG